MERPRIYSRTEERIPGEDLESRLEALRVVAGGLSASEMKATSRDDELRREPLDLLTRANQRVLAADERAVQLEADHRQREADLAAQIQELETRLQMPEAADARPGAAAPQGDAALAAQLQELETRLQMSEDANARLDAAKAAAEDRAARAEER